MIDVDQDIINGTLIISIIIAQALAARIALKGD